MAGRERRSSNREDGQVGDESQPKQCAVAGLSADRGRCGGHWRVLQHKDEEQTALVN